MSEQEKYSEEFIKECEDIDEYPMPDWWDENEDENNKKNEKPA